MNEACVGIKNYGDYRKDFISLFWLFDNKTTDIYWKMLKVFQFHI